MRQKRRDLVFVVQLAHGDTNRKMSFLPPNHTRFAHFHHTTERKEPQSIFVVKSVIFSTIEIWKQKIQVGIYHLSSHDTLLCLLNALKWSLVKETLDNDVTIKSTILPSSAKFSITFPVFNLFWSLVKQDLLFISNETDGHSTLNMQQIVLI